MNLADLPAFHWTHGRKDVKVLRHRDLTNDLWRLRREGKFADYQNGQSWDVFGTAKFIIAFIAERNRYAKFVGVWTVDSKKAKSSGGFRYATTELKGYGDIEGRLVIEWGSGARAWGQWLHREGNKAVTELLPPNSLTEEFRGYYDIVLTHDDLKRVVAYPDSNRELHRMLKSVSGVYIVLDQRDGRQYIGSAYGKNGIWGRWAEYAANPSGNNILLKALLAKDPDAHKHFQFAILRVLEPGVTKGEVLAQEVSAKRKLGSRAFGLNA